MKGFVVRVAAAAFTGFCLLAAPGQQQARAESAVYVDIRASESPDAEVVERWKLYGASHALVIGIDNYTGGWPRLSNAIKDARLVGLALEQRGFEVEYLFDASSDQLRARLRRFFAIKGADPEARLFVWFAGHGHTESGEGYLVPADAPPPGQPEFRLTALHMGDVGSMVRIAQSKHALAVFDSCFAGTIFSSQRARPPAAITRAAVQPVRQFLTSGDADQRVSDDGTFRKLFLRALNGEESADANGDGYLTGSELSLHLEDRMINLTQAVQTPRGGKLRDPKFDRGDFLFVLPRTAALTAPPKPGGGPDDLAFDLEFWNAIKDSDNPEDYQAYLDKYGGKGEFSALARLRYDRLKYEQDRGLLAALPPADRFAIEEVEAPFVARRNATVRAGPSTDHLKVALLPAGTQVTVTGKVKGTDWLRVALSEAVEGYVYAPLLVDLETHEKQKEKASELSEGQVAVGIFPKNPEPGATFRDCLACPEMVVVPAGSFMMGSPASEEGRDVDEGPRHQVMIPRGFAVGKYEVTFDEWDACAADGACGGYRPDERGWGRENRPVINVIWRDAQSYVDWLSRKTGKPYRLPSEAEWEYAARAQSEKRYWWGHDLGVGNANCGGCGSKWDYEKTAPVGSFRPNDFGLYDTAGNVWEWVEDCRRDSYEGAGAPTDGRAWTTGDCGSRVLRGGAWVSYPGDLRSANRLMFDAGYRRNFIGLRVARTLP